MCSSATVSPHLAAGLALKGGSHPDLAPSMVLERPKVIHHDGTGKFALWLHIDNANYTKATAGVAVADSPLGPFTYLGSLQPSGQMARDITVFKVCSDVRWCVKLQSLAEGSCSKLLVLHMQCCAQSTAAVNVCTQG